MNLLASKCNSMGYFKKEYIFLGLIATLILFSFLGSAMTRTEINFFSKSTDTVEGYSDKAQAEAQEEEEELIIEEERISKALVDSEKIISKEREIYMGIPRSQIPIGQENLYIRKSQVVPPVCPECPPLLNQENEEDDECPPCASCKRCPEPSFVCKEIPSDLSNPSYLSSNASNAYLPRPLLTNFGEFGM